MSSSSPETTDTLTLRTSRTVAADRVWSAWTDPVHLSRWLWPARFETVCALDLRLQVLDVRGELLHRYEITDASTETAFVFGEIYRRGQAWKVRAVGQGWASGLAGLAEDFGVTIDSADADADAAADDVRAAGHVADDDAVSTASGSTPEPVPVTSVDEPVVDALVIELPTSDSAPRRARRPRSAAGVRTRKQGPPRTVKPAVRLADDESWQPARLFSVSGVGGAEEQEKRATSALLATMLAVKPFARGISARFGAPAGLLETYLEVPFARGETKAFPDGVTRVARGDRVWTGLLEVKTGSGQLRVDQVDSYVDVARREGFDAVITLSNEISPGAGEHPVPIDQRKLKKVGLFHLSWAEVVHEARMVLTHRGVEDPAQAWILAELVRYLQHPRSGASGFEDMGAAWVQVREAVLTGTLRPSDKKVPAVAESWSRLVRQLCLQLTSELGVPVTVVLPRKIAADPAARTRSVVDGLVTDGAMSATLRIPGAAGQVTVTADLRMTRVRVSTTVQAPQEGTSHRRVSWLVRQLKEPPAGLLVEASFHGSAETTCEQLTDVRDSSAALAGSRGLDIKGFALTLALPMGGKRSGVRGAFIPSVTGAVEVFYGTVLQPLRAWVAPAPRLPEESSVTDEAGESVVLVANDQQAG